MIKKYSGGVVPMVTPFTKEGKLDTLSVVKICQRFVEFGVSPLLLGTTGESTSVSISESRLLVKTAVEAIKERYLFTQAYAVAPLAKTLKMQNSM